MANEITIQCDGASSADIDSLMRFQGDLKRITNENLAKLKGSILRHGFSAPIFAWVKNRNYYIIDGHGRLEALRALRAEGYVVPKIPVTFISAETKREAKEILLHITSQYGEFQTDQLDSFMADLDVEFHRLTDGEMLLLPPEYVIADEEERETEEREYVCPKCGHTWER